MKYYPVSVGILIVASRTESLVTNQNDSWSMSRLWVLSTAHMRMFFFVFFLDFCCLFVKSHEIFISLTSSTWVYHHWILLHHWLVFTSHPELQESFHLWGTYQNRVKTKVATSLSFHFLGIHLSVSFCCHAWFFLVVALHKTNPPKNIGLVCPPKEKGFGFVVCDHF